MTEEHGHAGAIPKRKPVPRSETEQKLPDSAVSPPAISEQTDTGIYTPASQNNGHSKLSLAVLDKLPLGPLEKYLPYDRRRRRYIIAGGIGCIIAILALIIGLAAGLSTKKKYLSRSLSSFNLKVLTLNSAAETSPSQHPTVHIPAT